MVFLKVNKFGLCVYVPKIETLLKQFYFVEVENINKLLGKYSEFANRVLPAII